MKHRVRDQEEREASMGESISTGASWNKIRPALKTQRMKLHRKNKFAYRDESINDMTAWSYDTMRNVYLDSPRLSEHQPKRT